MNPIDCLAVGYFASLHAEHISLYFTYCFIGDKGCTFLTRELLKCPESRCKLSLYLTGNDINNDEGMYHIAKLLTNTTLLYTIYFSANEIGNNGLNILCEALSTNTSLTHLILRKCLLTLIDHGAIPRLLRTNITLQHLDLSCNIIDKTELRNLCDSLLANTSLTQLNLNNCSLILDDHGATPQLPVLRANTTLQHLNLSQNIIGNTELSNLCDALSTNTSLTYLNLKKCSLTLNDHRAIPQLLRTSTTLQYLDLSDNIIGKIELSDLCDALSTNTSLTYLNLKKCFLTLNDHGAISQLLRTNTTLQHLGFSGNIINTELSNICDALSANTSLKTIKLSNCSITISDDNGAALYQLLSKNNSLERLKLSGNTVTCCHHIAAGLAANKTLKLLNLANCELSDRSIKELLPGLINNIEELYINNYLHISQEGIRILAKHLTTHCPKLKTLRIPIYLRCCIDSVFQITNEVREKNHLTEIRVVPA